MKNSRPVKGVSILGSTGSIGCSALDVIRRHPDRFRAAALAAGGNIKLLKKQVDEFSPDFVSVLRKEDALELKKSLPRGVKVGFGKEGVEEAAVHEGASLVLSSISGAAGLLPTIAAIRAKKDIALANKETLVMAGPIVMKEVARAGVKFLPVDSEHCAIFQALSGHRKKDIKKIILTASGGPFLKAPLWSLKSVAPKDALKHPKWKMGRKITIDSATLMNKGLEVIEARWLFDITPDKIDVAVHPQSIVHSMVEYIDGSIVAQLSAPDMRGPIAYAFSYPERIDAGTPELKLSGLKLDFSEPDAKRFPCLGLAYDALEKCGTAPAALNAADEVAVNAFLSGKIPFTAIYEVISGVMDGHRARKKPSLGDIIEADAESRHAASVIIKSLGKGH